MTEPRPTHTLPTLTAMDVQAINSRASAAVVHLHPTDPGYMTVAKDVPALVEALRVANARVRHASRAHQHCMGDLIQWVGNPAADAITTRDDAQRAEIADLHAVIADLYTQIDTLAAAKAAELVTAGA